MKRFAIPIAAVALFFFGGWTLRNKLAADRQGEWVSVARGDLVTGVEVAGTLAAVESDTLGPPQIPDVWDFKISMLAPEGTEVKKGRPVLAFDRGSVREVIDQGVTGCIVANVREAIQAVRWTSQLDRKAVRRRFDQRFTTRRMADAYLRLYRTLLAQRSRDNVIPMARALAVRPGAEQWQIQPSA